MIARHWEAGAFQRRGDHRFGKHMFIGGRDFPGTFQQQLQPCTGHAHARDLGNVGQGLIRLEFLFGQHDFVVTASPRTMRIDG